jgi:hypothetical protein
MTTPAGYMRDGNLVVVGDYLARMEQVMRLDGEKRAAVAAGDWITAMRRADLTG